MVRFKERTTPDCQEKSHQTSKKSQTKPRQPWILILMDIFNILIVFKRSVFEPLLIAQFIVEMDHRYQAFT
jgi:hypothetical protein